MIITKKFRGIVDYSFLYDDTSKEFKDALADYKALIKKKGTVEDMLKYIAASIHKNGIEEMVEGVGYIHRRGFFENNEERKKYWSGIYVKDNNPDMFYYEL